MTAYRRDVESPQRFADLTIRWANAWETITGLGYLLFSTLNFKNHISVPLSGAAVMLNKLNNVR